MGRASWSTVDMAVQVEVPKNLWSPARKKSASVKYGHMGIANEDLNLVFFVSSIYGSTWPILPTLILLHIPTWTVLYTLGCWSICCDWLLSPIMLSMFTHAAACMTILLFIHSLVDGCLGNFYSLGFMNRRLWTFLSNFLSRNMFLFP